MINTQFLNGFDLLTTTKTDILAMFFQQAEHYHLAQTTSRRAVRHPQKRTLPRVATFVSHSYSVLGMSQDRSRLYGPRQIYSENRFS